MCHRLKLFLSTFISLSFCFYLLSCSMGPSNPAYKDSEEHLQSTLKPAQSSNNDLEEEPSAYTFSNNTSELSIMSVGDIMFHMQQITAAEENGGYNFNPMFSEVKDLISSADISVGNLETTINPSKKPAGYPCFNAPVQALQAIKKAGFDVLLGTNNHSFDTGIEGVKSTNKLVKEYGFRIVGTGEPLEDKSIVVEKNNIKVGMAAYTYGTNFGYPNKDMINYIDENKIKADIEKIKSNCDFIIVYLHIGNEYIRGVEEDQARTIKNIAKMGADAILCSHPHVTRKTEMLNVDGRQVLVNYSMGNFVSNMDDKYTDMGSISKLTLEKRGSTTRIKDAETIPVYRLRYYEGGKRIVKAVAYSDVKKYNNILSKDTISYIGECSKDISYSYSSPSLFSLRSRAGIGSSVR